MTKMADPQSDAPPEEIDVTIDTRSVRTSWRCVIEIDGALVTAEDGRTMTGGIVRGFGAVASVMERKLRDEYEPLLGTVEQRDGWLEVTAIWDDDRLIDGDGANIVAENPDDD